MPRGGSGPTRYQAAEPWRNTASYAITGARHTPYETAPHSLAGALRLVLTTEVNQPRCWSNRARVTTGSRKSSSMRVSGPGAPSAASSRCPSGLGLRGGGGFRFPGVGSVARPCRRIHRCDHCRRPNRWSVTRCRAGGRGAPRRDWSKRGPHQSCRSRELSALAPPRKALMWWQLRSNRSAQRRRT